MQANTPPGAECAIAASSNHQQHNARVNITT